MHFRNGVNATIHVLQNLLPVFLYVSLLRKIFIKQLQGTFMLHSENIQCSIDPIV